jgi:iron complex outermembrane receptor protein
MKLTRNFFLVLGCGCLLTASPSSAADESGSVARQNGSSGTSGTSAVSAQSEGMVELSPFVVSTQGDDGYRAANTLSGSRVNTKLSETPAAISVLTKELMEDIGAKNTTDFLDFATNAGTAELKDDPQGSNFQVFDVRVKLRGFGSGTITRDYFRFNYQTDRYNIDRVDLSRGPNAVLYGIGAPGGVVNTSTKQAIINGRQKSASISTGSWNARRAEMDLAFPLIKDALALRINGIAEDKEDWRDFKSFRQKGLALAAAYVPFKNTQIRAAYERIDRNQTDANPFPVVDQGGSRWILAGAPLSGNPLLPGTNPNATLLRNRTLEQVVYAPQLRAQPFRLSTIGGDMRPDLEGIQGAGYWDTLPGPNAPITGQVMDPYVGVVVPLKANLTGPANRSPNGYNVGSIFLEQRLGQLFAQASFGRLHYTRNIRTVSISNGVIGDANLVLPGAYYADGDSRVAAGRLPGTLLPDIAAPNPYAGGLYVEGQAQTRDLDQKQDQARLSLGYELDLTKRSKWFGRHSVAWLWESVHLFANDFSTGEYNVTPKNNQLLDSATNTIWRRTYLDFKKPGGLRGALDPWATPIPTSTGVRAAFLQRGAASETNQLSKDWMIAGQSKFLNDRIIFTGGFREDVVETNRTSSGAARVPNSTNLWTGPHTVYDPAALTRFYGHTATLGVVFSPFRWLGLAYNQANSIIPQAGLFTLLGKPIPNVDGQGKDYGLRLNLLRDRFYININRFQTDQLNSNASPITTPRTLMIPALQTIVDTQRILRLPLPKSMTDAGITELVGSLSRETSDTKADGAEIELVGQLAKGWSASVNFARTNMTAANLAPDTRRFMAEVKGVWDGNPTPVDQTNSNVAVFVRTRDNTPVRDFALNPATFNDTYDYAQTVLDVVNQGEGRMPNAHVQNTFNFFTSYRFDSKEAPGILKAARAGFGGNYRSAPVIGYDAAENNAAFFGTSYFLVNAMVGKTFPLRDKRSIDFQLNINNLFGVDDLQPYNATAPGNIVRYAYLRPYRNWEVRATYKF